MFSPDGNVTETPVPDLVVPGGLCRFSGGFKDSCSMGPDLDAGIVIRRLSEITLGL